MSGYLRHIKHKIVCALFCLFISIVGYTQVNQFELNIVLKYTGNIPGCLATLTNISNRPYVISGTANAHIYPYPFSSHLVPEIEMKDGSIKEGTPQGFFYLEHERNIYINSKDSYKIWIPIPLWLNDSRGVIQDEYINEIKKIRFRIEKFKALTMDDDIENYQVVDTTLYSNWVDISKN